MSRAATAPGRAARSARSAATAVGRHREPFWRSLVSKPAWKWIKRFGAIAFLLVVATLIFSEARKVRWHEVAATIGAMSPLTLAAALGLAACSHLLYSCFDLLGRWYTGHHLPTRTVLGVTSVSYAFNLNVGTLIGGAGVRLRLYLQHGLKLDPTARIITLAMLTNWIGHLVLAGIVVILQPIPIPLEGLRDPVVRWLVGGALLAVPVAYAAAAGTMKQRVLQVRGHRLKLPNFRLAVLQIAMSCANWMIMATLIWTLLGGKIEYPAVLFALLAAAIAGVLLHVPAGLGVIEGVFVALLGDRLPKEVIIAALLAYRVMYYLLPLAIAAPMYFAFEMRVRGRKRESEATSK